MVLRPENEGFHGPCLVSGGVLWYPVVSNSFAKCLQKLIRANGYKMKLIPISETGKIGGKEINLPPFAQEALTNTVKLYQTVDYIPPWISYLAFENKNYVGGCAFKSPPVNNNVEIAYFTFPDYEGHGVATRMAEKLVRIALEENENIRIFAQTLPEIDASTTILRKLGFNKKGKVVHKEDGVVWEWHLTQEWLKEPK